MSKVDKELRYASTLIWKDVLERIGLDVTSLARKLGWTRWRTSKVIYRYAVATKEEVESIIESVGFHVVCSILRVPKTVFKCVLCSSVRENRADLVKHLREHDNELVSKSCAGFTSAHAGVPRRRSVGRPRREVPRLTCKTKDCNDSAVVRGFCMAHYHVARRNGLATIRTHVRLKSAALAIR